MSGGSYGYLYAASVDRLVGDRATIQEMERMIVRLRELGYTEASKETLELLSFIEDAVATINERVQTLAPAWKSVEWIDSFDSSIESERSTLDSVELTIDADRKLRVPPIT